MGKRGNRESVKQESIDSILLHYTLKVGLFGLAKLQADISMQKSVHHPFVCLISSANDNVSNRTDFHQ